MKKFIKRLLISASAIFLSGAITVLGVYIGCDFNHSKVLNNEFFSHDEIIKERYTSINLDVTDGDFNFYRSEDDNTYLKIKETKKVYHEFKIVDDVLNIKRISKLEWNDDWYNHPYYLKEISLDIYIPYYLYDNITCNVDNGNIKFAGGFQCNNISLTTKNGDISVSELMSFNDVTLTCKKTGNINVDTLLLKNALTLKTTKDISAHDIRCKYFNVDTIDGNINISKLQRADIFVANTVKGYIKIDECFANTIRLSATSRNVTITDCDVMNLLSIKTTRGNVDVTLNSPKRYIITSLQNKIDVPSSAQGAPLVEITTTYGKIKVSINGIY